jgi:hypothetical protein
MGSRNCTALLNLMEGSKEMGKVIVRAEPISGSSKVFTMNFEGHGMAKTYFCIQEKTFFTVSKKMTRVGSGGTDERQRLINSGEEDEWLKVYETELGRGNSVYFNQFSISSDKLCSNDLDTPLRVECMSNPV